MDTKYISIGIPIIASIVSIVVAFTTVKDANKYIQIEVNEMKATQNSILDDIEELKENH